MNGTINTTYILSALLYSLMGLAIFGLGFWVFDRLTPYALWKEIVENKNIALALMVGLVSLGICIIIASAIHG